ncbi:glycosyltransferase family A protein [Bacillota bacterium LCP21S3_F9]
MQEKITVFTPTYNRAYILSQLYQSLLRQNNKEFCWLIVDDGSTDNTKALVEQWIKDNKIRIKYYYQKNSGKMPAHNLGVEMTETKLFVCVDSDDYLVNNAIDLLIEEWEKYHNSSTIGIIAKRGLRNGKPMGKGDFPHTKICKMNSFMGKTFSGDTTICFETSKLNKYKFPVIKGEKFITEAYVYDQIDHDGYRYIILNDIVTICEYRPDGYTMNMDLISYQNPIGRMYHEAQNLQFACSLSDKIKACIRYNMYRDISHHKEVRNFSFFERLLLTITVFPGYVLYKKKRKRISNINDVE